jgi:hypothetical protein
VVNWGVVAALEYDDETQLFVAIFSTCEIATDSVSDDETANRVSFEEVRLK